MSPRKCDSLDLPDHSVTVNTHQEDVAYILRGLYYEQEGLVVMAGRNPLAYGDGGRSN